MDGPPGQAMKKRKIGRPPKADGEGGGGRKRGEDLDGEAGPSGRIDAGQRAPEKKWPKGLLAPKLPGLMYACGDSREPLQECVELVEEFALDYLMRVIHKATSISITNKVGHDDVLMVLRQDPGKFARARELLNLREDFESKKSMYEARNDVNDEFMKTVEEEEGAGGDD